MRRIDLDLYREEELWSWVEASLGDVGALTELVRMLHEPKLGLDALLSQDVYGDYSSGCVLEWWLEGCSGFEAVQHLDLVGFDSMTCVYHLVRELDLDLEEAC